MNASPFSIMLAPVPRYRVKGCVHTDDLDACECEYEPGELPRHTHERAGFCLVLDGAYEQRSAVASLRCVPSTLIFHPAGVEHTCIMSARATRCFTVEIAADVMASLSHPALTVERVGGSGVAHWLAYRMRAELQSLDDLTPSVMEGLGLAFVSECVHHPGVRVDRAAPPWLARVREQVHEAVAHPPSLATLAAGAGVHRVHVARAFRAHYECTVGEYIRRRRIEIACRLLLTTDAPLSDVGIAAGFADQSHFTTTFRRVVGMTPRAFRGCGEP